MRKLLNSVILRDNCVGLSEEFAAFYTGDIKGVTAFIDQGVINEYLNKKICSAEFKLTTHPSHTIKIFLDKNTVCSSGNLIFPAVLYLYFRQREFNRKQFIICEVTTDEKYGYFANNTKYGSKAHGF